MGYRNYIGEMPKKEYNKIKSLTIDGIFDFYKIYRNKEEEEGEDEDYDSRYKCVFEFGKELYEFGKYVGFKPPKGSIKTFFKNKDAEAKWNDENELKIVTKEFLKYIIESYREKINNYYQDMLNPFYNGFETISEFLKTREHDYDKDYNTVYKGDIQLITAEENIAINKIIDHVKNMSSEWKGFGGYFHIDLENENDEVITHSWKYEYAIFELVRIYKTFDWKRKVMIYYGY